MISNEELQKRLSKIKLFLCDVDGIMTDSSVFVGLEHELKRFHIRDGLGLVFLRDQGIKVGWVSKRPSSATTLRAAELKIDFLEQNTGGKVEIVEALLKRTGFTWEETLFMGDDVVDLGVMRRVGFAASVSDGVDEVKAISHFTSQFPGGRGAVREVVELLLKAQNLWEKVLEDYST